MWKSFTREERGKRKELARALWKDLLLGSQDLTGT